MKYLSLGKRGEVDQLVYMILFVVVILLILFFVPGTLWSGVKTILKIDSEVDDAVDNEGNLEKLELAFTECKAFTGVNCLCETSQAVELKEGEVIAFERNRRFSSSDILETTLISSSKEGSKEISNAGFCFIPSGEVVRDQCVYEYNNGDIIGGEKTKFIFVDNKWGVLERNINGDIDTVKESRLDVLLGSILGSGKGLYAMDVNYDDSTGYYLLVEGEQLKIRGYQPARFSDEKKIVDENSILFNGNVYAIKTVSVGGTCITGDAKIQCVTNDDTILNFNVDEKEIYYGTDSFFEDEQLVTDLYRVIPDYVYYDGINLYFGDKTEDFTLFKNVLSVTQFDEPVDYTCGGITDTTIKKLCAELKDKEYLGGLLTLGTSVVGNKPTLGFGGHKLTVNGFYGDTVFSEGGFNEFDLRDACLGMFNEGRLFYSKDKSVYKYSGEGEYSDEVSVQMKPVRLYRNTVDVAYVDNGEEKERDVLFICAVPEGFTANTCGKTNEGL